MPQRIAPVPVTTDKATQLEAENQALRRLLQTVSQDAAHNQDVMQRFQERELSLLSAQDLPDLLERLTIGLRSSFALDSVQLVLFDPFGVIDELLSGLGCHAREISHLQLVQEVEKALPHYPDLYRPWLGPWQQENHRLLFNGSRIRSLALLPLRQPDGLSGFLHLGSHDPKRFQPQQATDFLQRLASVAAVCLENAVNRERLRLTGLTDGLTGLYNRRHLDKRLQEEIARACRHRHPLTCLFIDADHFKEVNDQHGHAAGDQVLIALSRYIKGQLRGSDLAARYGGEEIAVLLPQTDVSNGRLLAERIRRHIASNPVSVPEIGPISITVSIGVAQLDSNCRLSDTDLGERLLSAADQQVYLAKRQGRNCVKVAL